MSSKQFERVITTELDKVNNRIDLKIIKGRSYRQDARRHKLLLQQLTYHQTRQTATPRLFSIFL
ncbi:MAG: hypothetical protein O2794_02830 [bacterium]|nr:hypothetical protein [bacterium]